MMGRSFTAFFPFYMDTQKAPHLDLAVLYGAFRSFLFFLL
ncbi:hypothetical protein FTV88_0873 [Heliorestis convoluta]|uniref:Uncharacterized protein n=1 Tax=Heliorestis convoluta TaxID=356322 RepID=A0A5Q2MZV5_9FIRM|nr:hypothetical protein FTV88_0873 [Heliorestis convoluta]